MEADRQKKLDAWYVVHAGVVTMEKLTELGFSESAVYRMIDRKVLIVLQAGVYQTSQYPTGDLQRQIAVCLRNPNVAIAFISAAVLWGFRGLPKNRLIHVLVPHGCSPDLKGVIVPQLQYAILLPGGHTIRFDFAWPERWAALEVDHPFWHAGDEQTHSDKWRDRKAGTLGWSTTRITNLDVEGGLCDAIEDVAVILTNASPAF